MTGSTADGSNIVTPPAEFWQGASVDSGGGPPHDGNMEQRVTRLEVIAEELRDDVRDIRTDMRDIRSDIKAMRDEFRADFKSVRKELWIAALTVVGISVAAMYGIVQTTIAAIDAGRASAQVQQPIIVTVPSPPVTAAPKK